MSKKVYDVNMWFRNDTIVDETNWSYIDSMVVKTFSSEKLAAEYIEENFVRFMNEMDDFCDLFISEKYVDEEVEPLENKVAPASYFWVCATLDRFFNVKALRKLIKDDGNRKDLKEHESVNHEYEEYSVCYKMPMVGIKTRKDVIAYIEKRAENITDTL